MDGIVQTCLGFYFYLSLLPCNQLFVMKENRWWRPEYVSLCPHWNNQIVPQKADTAPLHQRHCLWK